MIDKANNLISSINVNIIFEYPTFKIKKMTEIANNLISNININMIF